MKGMYWVWSLFELTCRPRALFQIRCNLVLRNDATMDNRMNVGGDIMASVEKRGNWWRITISRVENGKEVKYRKKLPGDMRLKDVDKEAKAFETDVNQGKETSVMMGATVAEFAQEWFTHHVKSDLASSIQDEYKSKLNNFILPALGGIRIRDLRPQHIIKFLNDTKQQLDDAKQVKLEKMLAECEAGIRTVETVENYKRINSGARQIKYCYQVLNSMLASAVYWQVLPINPCASVKAPKYKAPEAGFYDADEAGAFLAALEGMPSEWMHYRIAATLSIFTTLRRSEVLGLRWQDVDFENHTLTVAQKLYWSKGMGFILEEPKTDKSARTVNLGEYTIALLKAYLDIQNSASTRKVEVGNKYNRSGLIIVDHAGQPIKPYLITNWFSRFLRLNNLPHLSFHGLRHTAITNMIHGGFDLMTAGEIAGHSQKSTTANIYAHVIENNKKAASNALEINLLRHRNG